MSERYRTRPALTAAVGCGGAILLAVICGVIAVAGGALVAVMSR